MIANKFMDFIIEFIKRTIVLNRFKLKWYRDMLGVFGDFLKWKLI